MEYLTLAANLLNQLASFLFFFFFCFCLINLLFQIVNLFWLNPLHKEQKKQFKNKKKCLLWSHLKMGSIYFSFNSIEIIHCLTGCFWIWIKWLFLWKIDYFSISSCRKRSFISLRFKLFFKSITFLGVCWFNNNSFDTFSK